MTGRGVAPAIPGSSKGAVKSKGKDVLKKPGDQLLLDFRLKYIILTYLLTFFFTIGVRLLHAGPYTDSAHGNSSYGVNRTSLTSFNYTKGNCAHCHEQHASIGGVEPTPTGGPDKFLLFSENYTDQATEFCFDCHKGAGSYQTPLFNNYCYSYQAGGDTSITCPDNILEAFSFIDEAGSSVSNCGSTTGTSHKLTDIKTFINGRWDYTADSNPCIACHNPHRAKRDPHSIGSRGWPVSRPSDHDSTWELWGDDSDEKMSNYTSRYQAPYRYNSTSAYEPDGSSVQDGSNLTDYVTFCTDCHNATNIIYSTTLGRNLKTVDWDNEKHGKGDADAYIKVDSPYSSTIGYVLSCLDCHEPHGAPNVTLIRQEVNGAELAGTITIITSTDCTPQYGDNNDEMKYLCTKCHDDNFEDIHHSTTDNDACYEAKQCADCHEIAGGAKLPINCNCCHYHGSSRLDCNYAPTTRRTF